MKFKPLIWFWKSSGSFMYEPVDFLCFTLQARADDATEAILKKGPFMYGFFHGYACYHAVDTSDAREWLEANFQIVESRGLLD